MKAQGVHLIISNPFYVAIRDGVPSISNPVPFFFSEPEQKIVLIPIRRQNYLCAYYLNPHQRIEELIRKGIILRYRHLPVSGDE
jgi:hypothetical protein